MEVFPKHKAFKKGQVKGGVAEYTLGSNGLKVLLSVDHSAPAAGVMVTYAVGSRNEKDGHTGAAHLLEHMMFKGSKNFNKEKGNDAMMLLERVGAKINATTWLDRTNYFEVVPIEHLDTALAVEADRMRDAFLTEEEFIPERAVVMNELVRYENEPTELLDTALWAEAFKKHPYHHPTIGTKHDVEHMSLESLTRFYNTYYFPNNATLSVFGDIEVDSVLEKINTYFGHLPKSSATIEHEYPPEPAQNAPRHVEVSREGEIDIVAVSQKIPSALHADSPALDILAHALGVGKQSRLHLALVETNLATEISLMSFPFRDESLMSVYAFVAPGVSHTTVREVIEKEFENVMQNGVTQKEVMAAKAKVAAETAFSRDGVYATLQNVGTAVAIGDWTWNVTFPKLVQVTTQNQVSKVAKKYLTEKTRTTGYFVAKKESKKK